MTVVAITASFDSYSLRARLQPALIAVLPVGMAILAWFPDSRAGWGWFAAAATVSGLTLLMAEFARDQGKRLEPKLFASWGGKPTTVLLRHNGPLDRHTLSRYHAKLAALLPQLKMPDAEVESQRPSQADEVYESCVLFLLEKTRSRDGFPLVVKELTSYGFRRNLVGLRLAGITSALLGTMVCGWAVVTKWPDPAAFVSVGVLVVSTVLLLAWLALIRPPWVRKAADAYPRRLLAACETIAA